MSWLLAKLGGLIAGTPPRNGKEDAVVANLGAAVAERTSNLDLQVGREATTKPAAPGRSRRWSVHRLDCEVEAKSERMPIDWDAVRTGAAGFQHRVVGSQHSATEMTLNAPAGSATAYTYTYELGSDRIDTITDPLGAAPVPPRFTDIDYDAAGNVSRIKTAEGRVTTEVDPVFWTSTFEEDSEPAEFDEIVPPVDAHGSYSHTIGAAFGPSAATWSYVAPNPTGFYAMNMSGAQPLPKGNTLICDGPHGIFFKVTPTKEVVWKYVNSMTASGPRTQGDPIPGGQQGQENNVFRAPRYAPDYPAFAGKERR